jgi:hypothetical protein
VDGGTDDVRRHKIFCGTAKRETFGRWRRFAASRLTPRPSRWPTKPPTLPSLASEGKGGDRRLFSSRDIGRIWRVAEALEYGIVRINEGIISPKSIGEIAPFGGIKESGIGSLAARWARNTYGPIA